MYRMKDSYTPTDAKRANDELDRLVTTRSMTGWSSSEAHRTSRSACSEGHVLDSGGKEMKVQTTIQTPQGEQKRNVVYTKS